MAAYKEASGSQNGSKFAFVGPGNSGVDSWMYLQWHGSQTGCLLVVQSKTSVAGSKYATPEQVLADMKNDMLGLDMLPALSQHDQECEKNVSRVRSTEHAHQILDSLECTGSAGNVLQPSVLYAFIADLRWSDMSSLKLHILRRVGHPWADQLLVITPPEHEAWLTGLTHCKKRSRSCKVVLHAHQNELIDASS